MTDNITVLIAEARAFSKRFPLKVHRDFVNALADALEAVTRSRSNVLLLNTQITSGLNEAEAERDRYLAEAESSRKTGERILANALRYRAALEEIREWSARNGYPGAAHDHLHTILARALNEGKTDD